MRRFTCTIALIWQLLAWDTGAAQMAHGGPVTGLTPDSGSGFISSGFDGRIIAWSADLQAMATLLRRAHPLDRVSLTQPCKGANCAASLVSSPAADGAFAKAFVEHGIVIRVGSDGALNQSILQADQPPKPIGAIMGGILDIDHDGANLLVIARSSPPAVLAIPDNVSDKAGYSFELPLSGVAATSGIWLKPGRALIGSSDGRFDLVDTDEMSLLASAAIHPSPVTVIRADEPSGLTVTGSADGAVTLWKIEHDRLSLHAVIGQMPHPVLALALDMENDRVVVGGADGRLVGLPLNGRRSIEAKVRPAPLFAELGGDDDAGDKGARLFRACRACHSFAPDGDNKPGPTFSGLFGRKVGSLPDYPYSRALLDADFIWSEQTVSKLLEIGPEHYLPGTAMPLQRLPAADDRASLMAYIKRRDLASRGHH